MVTKNRIQFINKFVNFINNTMTKNMLLFLNLAEKNHNNRIYSYHIISYKYVFLSIRTFSYLYEKLIGKTQKREIA